MANVTVIIPTYNNWDCTQSCLTTLARHTSEVAVIVTDSCSRDETEAMCPVLGQALFGANFYYMRSPEACSPAMACNAAARKCKSDLLFFLDSEVEVTPDWLFPLLEAMESSTRVAGVGPLMLYHSGAVHHLGVTFWPLGRPMGHLYRNLHGTHPLVRKRRRLQAMTSAALLVPRISFLNAGGFCPDYVNGMEDVDLCLKLVHSGKYMQCVSESIVYQRDRKAATRYIEGGGSAELLSRRHRLFVHGDLDALLEQDGYELTVLPQLELAIALPEDRAQDLDRRMGDTFHPVRCFDLLEEEPFWSEGYIRLGAYLEAVDEPDTALRIYQQKLDLTLAPSFEDYGRVIRVAERLGLDTTSLHQEWNALLRAIHDQDTYAEQLDSAVHYLRSTGRKRLAQAYVQAAVDAARLREQPPLP